MRNYIREANRIFDYQSKWDGESHIRKEIFNLSYHMTPNDYKK